MQTSQLPSPLGDALRYASIGWHVFPCHRESKRPLTEHGFHDATTDEQQIRAWWQRHPDAAIAVACLKSNIAVIDLDCKDDGNGIEYWQRLQDEHGIDNSNVVQQTPSGGRHMVFRHPGVPVTTCDNVVPKSRVDVRGDGGYILVSSAIEPSRVWLSGSPLEDDFDVKNDLSDMPAWVVELVRASGPSGGSGGGVDGWTCLPAETVDRIRDAIQWIDPDPRDNWLHVGFALKSTGAGAQAYELWTEWSKRSPKFDEADQRRTWRFAREWRHNGSEVTLATLFWMAQDAGWQPPAVVTQGDLVAIDQNDDTRRPVAMDKAWKPEPFPTRLIQGDGLLLDVVRDALRTAVFPHPGLALGSSIAMFGAILGRKVQTRTSSRTNVYVLGIGETGCGKNHFVHLPPRLLMMAGGNHLVGPGEWKSDSGLRAALVDAPAHLATLDEFGLYIQAATGKNAPPHLQGIGKLILEVFSAAASVLPGSAYADRKMRRPEPIREPHLCIYGTTTPSTLFEGLSTKHLEDGLLGRCLIFHADAGVRKRRQTDGDSRIGAPPDPDIVRRIRHVVETVKSADAVADILSSAARTVPLSDEGMAVMSRVEDEEDAHRRRKDGGDIYANLWLRLAEHVGKLALLRQCADEPLSASVEAHNVRWAHEVVSWCLRRFEAETRHRLADTPHEAEVQRIYRLILDAGPAGISMSEITKATQGIPRAKRLEHVQTLVDGERARSEVIKTGGRGRPKQMFWATCNLEAAS